MKKIVITFNDKTVLTLEYSVDVNTQIMNGSLNQIQAIFNGKPITIMKSAVMFVVIEGV